MDIKKLIAMQNQEAAERIALLATLAIQRLPEDARHYLLVHIGIIKDPSQAYQHRLRGDMCLGSIGYAYTIGHLDSTGFQCLSDFVQTLTT